MERKILGKGEIGESILTLYLMAGFDEVSWKDLTKQMGRTTCDILHVCIPYNEEFIYSVCAEVKRSKASVVIIHSTVKPGTTRRIQDLVADHVVVVHSPVIGVHPNLYEGLITFDKWVGGDGLTQENIQFIADEFKLIDLNPRFAHSSQATELFKVWDTTYYGLCLAANAEVRSTLEEHGVPYAEWIEYLKNYNAGYTKLGMSNVVRPYFERLNMPIGGHCVKPNNLILNSMYESPIFDLIKKYTS